MRRCLLTESPVSENPVKEGLDMKGIARTGTVGEEPFVVSEQHLIDFAHDGMPQILCTPWLIRFLEHAARNAVLPKCKIVR